MKVYILYSNPYDEGAEIYGVFSTQEKVEKAIEVFSSKSNHELYFSGVEVDELEKHFERALSPEREYIGSLLSHIFHDGKLIVGKWDFHSCGLDSFLEGGRKNGVFDFGRHLSAHITAKSKEEAEEITVKMMKKLIEQPKDEMGWRYIQDEEN